MINPIQDIQLQIFLFDIIAYLEDINVDFEPGKKDWINFDCPFCGDSNKHLGVNLSNNILNCWKCGPKGNISTIVKYYENCNFYEALEVIEKYQNTTRLTDFTFYERERKKSLTIPKHFQKLIWPNIPKIVLNFVNKRGFNPEILFQEKELYYGTHLGDFKFRLIIPIYQEKTLVTYIGRDVTGKSSIPYLALDETLSVYPTKELLYGYDEITPGSNMVVIEGAFDQWKLGKGSVATFGSAWTMIQITLLRYLSPRKVIVLYDSEEIAQQQAKKLCNQIWFCEAESVMLEGVNDPGELSLEEGQEIMKELQKM